MLFVGNTMIDSLLRCRDVARRRNTADSLGLEARNYALLIFLGAVLLVWAIGR